MNEREYTSKELLRRFLPYYRPYLPVLLRDLGCAALTTVCEMVLPLIIRYITNTGSSNLAALTVGLVLKLSCLYFALRIIDSLANFYMAYTGHVMGTHIETDMRRAAYHHLQKLSNTYYCIRLVFIP